MGKLGVLILDFDGVIIESNAVKTDAFIQVFNRFPEHTEAMMEFHNAHVSLSRFYKFEHLLTLMGKTNDTELKSNIAEDFSSRVFEGMMKVPLVSGALTFLSLITPKIPVYLASVTPYEELVFILKQRELLQWFRGVYGCPPWTKPDAINDIISKGGYKPDQALLIGDSAGDQRAARTCGIKFLARNSGLSFDLPLPRMFQDMNEIANYFNTRFL
ncbi:MAG: HAD hydrolase-like protein [Bacteroidia bacterium]|nr:HAD hydrolase-like protein [Bacteroidia bacterium]